MAPATRRFTRQQSKKQPLQELTNALERKKDLRSSQRNSKTVKPKTAVSPVFEIESDEDANTSKPKTAVSGVFEIEFEEDVNTSDALRNKQTAQPPFEAEFSRVISGDDTAPQESLVLYRRRPWRPTMPKPPNVEDLASHLLSPSSAFVRRQKDNRRSSSSWLGSNRGRRSSVSSVDVPVTPAYSPSNVEELFAEHGLQDLGATFMYAFLSKGPGAIPISTPTTTETPPVHEQTKNAGLSQDDTAAYWAKQAAYWKEVDEFELEVESPSPIKRRSDAQEEVLSTPSPGEVPFVPPLETVLEEESHAEDEVSEINLAPATPDRNCAKSPKVLAGTVPLYVDIDDAPTGQVEVDQESQIQSSAEEQGLDAAAQEAGNSSEPQALEEQSLYSGNFPSLKPLALRFNQQSKQRIEEDATASGPCHRFVSLKPVTATFKAICEGNEEEEGSGKEEEDDANVVSGERSGGFLRVADIVARYERFSSAATATSTNYRREAKIPQGGGSNAVAMALPEKEIALQGLTDELHTSCQVQAVLSPPKLAEDTAENIQRVPIVLSPPKLAEDVQMLQQDPPQTPRALPPRQPCLCRPVELFSPQHQQVVQEVVKESMKTRSPLELLLVECNQSSLKAMSMTISEFCDPKQLVKIGEGTFGEVFKGSGHVLKVMPFGGKRLVNGECQKTIEEMHTEVRLTNALNRLRGEGQVGQVDNSCFNYIHTKGIRICKGLYDKSLLQAWDQFDAKYQSENDSPEMFMHDQFYVVFVQGDGGTPLDQFVVSSFNEARSILLQLTLALAVGEAVCCFEHRDLHWGNILLKKKKASELTFRLRGRDLRIKTFSLETAIIDFTLSRLDADGVVLFNDLSTDPELFTQTNGIQADTYRGMKILTRDRWEGRFPKTNCLWLHYVADILLNMKAYPCSAKEKLALNEFKKRVGMYHSAEAAVNDTLFNDLWL